MEWSYSHLMSSSRRHRPGPGIGTLLKLLIAINVVVFIAWVQVPYDQLPFMADHFVVSAESLSDGRVWTLISTFFSHADATHLLFNMIGLYVFGQPVRQVVGDRGLLTLYMVGGLCASLGHITSSLLTGSPAGALGASGSVMAIAVVFACLFPQTTLLINFFIPIRAWLAVLLFIGIDLFGAMGVTSVDQVFDPGNRIGHAAHLGGAVFGLLYYLSQIRPRRIPGRNRRLRDQNPRP